VSTKIKPRPADSDIGSNDDMDHYFCCDENLALCGTDVTGMPFGRTAGFMCVVCEELRYQPCERCGCK